MKIGPVSRRQCWASAGCQQRFSSDSQRWSCTVCLLVLKYNAFVTFWLSVPVLFCSTLRPGLTFMAQTTCFHTKRCLSGVRVTTIDDVIWGNRPPKPPKIKVGVIRQFQDKMPKYENRSKTVNPIKPKFEDKAETTTCTSWVGYHYPKPNPTWLMAAILKIAITS